MENIKSIKKARIKKNLDALADIFKKNPHLDIMGTMEKGFKMDEKKRIQTGLWMDEKIYKELKHIAVDENISISDLVEKAVIEFLKKYRREQG